MTPALKAMVEAMLAELHRQEVEPGKFLQPGPYVDDGVSTVDPEPDFNAIRIDGNVDLEKVARAGLAAISRSSIADNAFTWESRDPMASLEQSKRGVSFRRMIRAILGEKP